MTDDEWFDLLFKECGSEYVWVANKFSAKLAEHKRKYPAFQIGRVVEMFLRADQKTRVYYSYREIPYFTKSIHKSNSFRSFCESQS